MKGGKFPMVKLNLDKHEVESLRQFVQKKGIGYFRFPTPETVKSFWFLYTQAGKFNEDFLYNLLMN